MDISGNQSNINSSMNQYHENIHEYNENMRRYLQLIGDMHDYNYVNPNTRYPNPPIFNPHLYRGLNYQRNENENRTASNNILNTIFRTVLRTNNREYDDVVVRPTINQITNATELFTFNENETYNNTNCPITLEIFEEGEQLCRIKHCSHIFKPRAIQDWFSRNVRCPVCRYDIRDYVEPVRTTENNSVENMSEGEFDDMVQELLEENQINQSTSRTLPNPRSSFTNTLTSAIQSFITNEIHNLPEHMNNAAELLYTFDIPLNIDISFNRR